MDNAYIDSCAMKVIDELSAPMYDYCQSVDEKDKDDNRLFAIATLGNIRGVIDLAKELKKRGE